MSYIDEGTPEKLWEKYNDNGEIIYNDFLSYYQFSLRGVAIGIEKVWILKNPMHLVEIDNNPIPPQSFRYISNNSFKKMAGNDD